MATWRSHRSRNEVVVTIVGNHDSKVYDGTEYEVIGYDVTGISNRCMRKPTSISVEMRKSEEPMQTPMRWG